MQGNKHHKFPVRVFYFHEESNLTKSKVGVSVPKKLFKHASDRNLLKRRLRESYRIQQEKLEIRGSLEIMFVYSSNEIKDFQTIEKSVSTLIDFLNSSLGVQIENK